MSRRIAVLVIFLFVTITVLVSQPKLLWTTTKTNPDSTIQLSDAARDYSGNIYTVTFGGIKYGITLNKYSNVGTLIRETPLSSQITHKYRLAADKGGNAYVVTNDDQKKLTLTKYSPAGDSLWAKKLILSLPQNNYREGNSLIDIDGDGNVYLATEHEQRIPNGIFKTSLMVSSYSPAGQLRWLDTTVKAMPLNREPEYGDMLLGKMMIDQSNNVIISLASRSEINPSLFIAETKIVKYGPNGSGDGNTPHWVRTLAISGVNVEFSDMDVDEMGNIFIAYNHGISLSVGGRIRKYSSSGIAQWDRMTANSGAKLAADNNGGVYAGIGRSLSPTNVIARIFRFNGPESTYVGNFGIGNYSSIYNLAVDKGGYLAVSGVSKPQVFSTEGSYYFFEFTPSGTWNGYAMYASPGVSQEYPSHLFKGNGSYIALGVSGYAQSKAVVWISKIQVAPTTPTDPGGNGGGFTSEPGLQFSPKKIELGTTADLRGVWFNTVYSGFIVGDSSKIFRTTDEGATWVEMVSPVISNFQKVRFVNADTGFIVGKGCILRTIDGGNSWQAVSEAGSQTLYGIDWNGLGVVVAVGAEGTIRVSSDWGVTWKIRNFGTMASLRDVASMHNEVFTSEKFLSGGDGGIIITSNNFGESWELVRGPKLLGEDIKSLYSGSYSAYLLGTVTYVYDFTGQLVKLDNPSHSILSISKFRKGNPYFAVGENGSILKTMDFEGLFESIKVSDQSLFDLFQDGPFSITVGALGSVYKCIEGFSISVNNDHYTYGSVNDLTIINKQEALLISTSRSALYKTTNAGRNWVKVDTLGHFISVLQYPNCDTLWMIKRKNSSDINCEILVSTNKGSTWTNRTVPDSTGIEMIRFAGSKSMILRSNGGPHHCNLYRSMDIGGTWQLLLSDIFIDDLQAIDAQNIWASGIQPDTAYPWLNHVLYRSNNGGLDFQAVKTTLFSEDDSYNLQLIALNSTEAITSTNNYQSFRTDDGGHSWKESFFNHVGISYHPEHSKYFVSGDMISSNGGRTWLKDHSFELSNIGAIQRIRIDDSTYYLSRRKNSAFLSSPLWENNLPLVSPPIFTREGINKSISRQSSVSDTVMVPIGTVGNAVIKISVLLNEMKVANPKFMTITLSKQGIVDTLFHHHDGKNIFNCTLTDGSLNTLDSRYHVAFSGQYNPFSSLSKFKSVNASGNWVLTVYNNDAAPVELRSWSILIESDNVTNVKQNGIVPTEFALSQNYPNPFNPTTSINYQLPANSKVSLKIYDILGREVATLVNEVVNAGTYSTPFNSTRLASGVYFYRIEASSTDGSRNRFVDVKKMMYLK